MDTLEINKIVGAFVGALLVFLGAQFFAEEIFHGGYDDAEYAYAIPIERDLADVATEEIDIVTLIAMADPSRGERLYARCRACHQLQDPVNGTGPHLVDIVDREMAAVPGFNYSGALVATDEEAWTVENLYGFLTRPSAWAPGTSMAFAGLPNSEDRAALVAYLVAVGD